MSKTVFWVAVPLAAVLGVALGVFIGFQVYEASLRASFQDAADDIDEDASEDAETSEEDEDTSEEFGDYSGPQSDPEGFYAEIMTHEEWQQHQAESIPDIFETENEYKVDLVEYHGELACMAMEDGEDMDWYVQEEAAYNGVSVEAEQFLIDTAIEYLCPEFA